MLSLEWLELCALHVTTIRDIFPPQRAEESRVTWPRPGPCSPECWVSYWRKSKSSWCCRCWPRSWENCCCSTLSSSLTTTTITATTNRITTCHSSSTPRTSTTSSIHRRNTLTTSSSTRRRRTLLTTVTHPVAWATTNDNAQAQRDYRLLLRDTAIRRDVDESKTIMLQFKYVSLKRLTYLIYF